MTFSTAGQLTSWTDQHGHGLAFTYSGGLLSEITDATDRTVVLSFNDDDLLTSAALPDGRHVDYGYTTGRLTNVQDARGHSTTYGYDAAGRLTTKTDPLNHTTTTTYDSTSGRVVSQVDPIGDETTFAWDSATETATTTDANGGDWVDTYRDNVLTTSMDPLGNVSTHRYDEHLNLTSTTDPMGNRTRMSYDADGNMLTRTAPEPLSFVEQWTYDDDHNVLSYTDGRGNMQTLTYTAFGERTSSTNAEGHTATASYDANGQLASQTDPRGNAGGADPADFTTVFTHDAAGNLTAQIGPLGEETSWTYDSSGRPITMVDPRGNAAGADPADFTWTYIYDEADHLVGVADPLRHETTTAYDAARNQAAVTDALDRITQYGHDAANQLAAVTDPAGGVTTITYDAAGNKISEQDPEGNTTTFGYDLAGRLTSTVSPRGNTAGADPADFTWASTYDWNGNPVRTSHSDPAGGGTPITTQISYDVLNRPVTVTDPNGHTTTTEYDNNDTRTYDRAGRVAFVSTASGTDILSSFDYTRDAVGSPTEIGTATTTQTAAYDPLNRLTNYCLDTACTDFRAYTYDPNDTGTGELIRRYPAPTNMPSPSTRLRGPSICTATD